MVELCAVHCGIVCVCADPADGAETLVSTHTFSLTLVWSVSVCVWRYKTTMH